MLVLNERGNINDYEFRYGYLNCGLGQQRSGIANIEFNPFRFGWWEEYDHVSVDASPSELLRHVGKLDYSEKELNVMTTDIWKIRQQAERGDPLSSNTSDAKPIWETPDNGAHHQACTNHQSKTDFHGQGAKLLTF